MPDHARLPTARRRGVLARFRLPFVLIALAVLAGTAGYHWLFGWNLLDAVYMTVTTLTTVGYRELHPLDPAGRIFTIVVIMLGVLALFSAVTVGAEALASGELAENRRKRRMNRRIEDLKDHYIVCAYGRVGRAAVDELAKQEIPFLVIEVLPELAPLLEEHGVPFITADPSDETVLKRAGIERAKGLLCAVDSDAVNVYITLTARALNPHINIVARASNPKSVAKLEQAGANRVVSPYAVSGSRMALLATQPSVVDFLDVVSVAPDLRVEEIVVRDGSPLDGRTIADARVRHTSVTIVAVKHRDGELDPKPDENSMFRPGDIVVVLGPARALDDMAG